MFEKEYETAIKAARAAGLVLSQKFGSVLRVRKKGAIDLVTEADLAAEKVILEMLKDLFPDDRILSEEAGTVSGSSARSWIIDPLDGTTNFTHGFPFFAVSIGLEVEKEIVLGVVYNPFMDEFFEAKKGEGAFLNGASIQVSGTQALKDALLATGFPYDIKRRADRVFEWYRKMTFSSRGVRRAGSAALDMCYVASGRLDGLWEEGLKPWDTAAGTVIVLEAGGRLSTCEGETFSPYRPSIIASTPLIHEAMVGTLKA